MQMNIIGFETDRMKKCDFCGTYIERSAKTCFQCGAANKHPQFKKWWILIIVAFAAIIVFASRGGDADAIRHSNVSSPESATETARQNRFDSENPNIDATTRTTTSESENSAASTPAPATDSATPDLTVYADELIDEFDDNELRADAKYEGKTLEVIGVVTNIDTELFDDEKYILSMNGGGDWDFLTVRCYDIDPGILMNIDIGSTISVIGDFDDGGDLGVAIRNCHINTGEGFLNNVLSPDSTAGTTRQSPAESENSTASIPAPATDSATPDLTVYADELIEEFDDNELRADAKYKGKTLEVIGVVTNIDAELFDDEKYILSMNGGGDWDFLTVSCYDIDPGILMNVDIGSTISVIGDFDDGGDLGVILKNCSIVRF
jgi:hypothetical protein